MAKLKAFADEKGYLTQAWSAFGMDAAVWLAGGVGAVMMALKETRAFGRLIDLIAEADHARTELAATTDGVDVVCQRGWYSSTNFWSPALFDRYVYPHLAELVALSICNDGLPVVVVNPCAPVGPRDIKPSSTGQRILDYLHGKQPSFVPGGINFVSVQDVAEGQVLAAERGSVGRRYILGNKDGNLSLPGFTALMERVSGIKPPSRPREHRTGRTARRLRSVLRLGRSKARNGSLEGGDRKDSRPMALTCDPTRAIHELGLPQTPLATALAEAVAWFRENGYVRT